jgi:site-specific DNA recombinase
MGTPAAHATAAEPVGVAALTRTSSRDLQDPVASCRRQLRAITGWLPPGWYIAAVYSDVESGAIDIEDRSQGDTWRVLTDAGLPRDGGMADLLAEAASPDPRFSVVAVEDIERASRDTFNSLKLEKELSGHGIPLFATDEPADITGISATTILVRRVKQGVAEWYRLQLKGKARKGLEEHAIAGYNTGPVPYGYQPDRSAHPVPAKASAGLTKTRLAIDPGNGPWVTQIFTWRVAENLSREAIAGRLDALGAPSPDGNGWSAQTVGTILANPKYTGYMVYGRTKNVGKSQRKGERKVTRVPRDQWIWSDAPTHPALITREVWDAAQDIGAAHARVRDAEVPAARPARRTYPLRSRVRCNQCQRRMVGATRDSTRPGLTYTYYICPHRRHNPRDHAAAPGHIRAAIREETLTAAIARFLDDYVLGHDRAAMLTAELPATAAEEAARRNRQADQLRTKIARLETAEKGLMTELAQLGGDTSPAANAYRARIRDSFTAAYADRTATQAQLDALTTTPARENDPSLLDELPYAPGYLLDAPDTIRQALYAALGIQCLYRADKHQATIWATITDTTPGILTALIASPRTDHDTGPAPDPFANLANASRAPETANIWPATGTYR